MLVVLMLLFTLSGRSSAQDSTLSAAVHRILTSQLVGGGRRDTLVWEAKDSTTLRLLRGGEFPRSHSVRPALAGGIRCPGGTDRDGMLLPQPVGYTVAVAMRSDSAGHPVLAVEVWCTFVYRGGEHGFAEGGTWSITRSGGRWILGEEIEHWIT
jgi:hypothetical protein